MPGSFNPKTAKNVALQRFKSRLGKESLNLQYLWDHTFDGENFSRADFSSTRFKNVIFNSCNLDDASFRGTTLSACIFYGGSLNYTVFNACSLDTCLFVDVELTYAVVDSRTALPDEYSWMKTLVFKGIDREAQVYLWRNYPRKASDEDKKCFVVMAELEHGSNL